MSDEKKEGRKEATSPSDFEAPRIWDYEKAKKLCAVCGGETEGVGHTIPFCRPHEIEWIASEERTQAATARRRFVERRRKELGLKDEVKEGAKEK